MDYPKRPGVVLTPLAGIARYLEHLRWYLPDGRVVVNPALFGTVYFEGGARPEVRQGLLACFDEFERRFGQYLRGGRLGGSKYSAKTAKGVEAIRKAIIAMEPQRAVEFMRSDITDQYTAPDYALDVLTNKEFPSLGDGGMLSYLKFILPWDMATDGEIEQYHAYLRFVCETLPVRGGHGGLAPVLPFDRHRYQPQEYVLAKRFTGLDMDSAAHLEAELFRILSQEGDRETGPVFSYLKPGANVLRIGHIKCVNWYTILGDVFVERLGGESALREQLARPDIGVERRGQCLLIRAGDFPRLGAPEEGLIEPYAFVNRAVRSLRDPEHGDMHTYMEVAEYADEGNTRAWLARFDLPEDGSVVPWTPEIGRPAAAAPALVPSAPSGRSARPGDICPEAGDWYAIHLGGKTVRIEAGEVMPGPEYGSSGSAVVWYLKPR